jgi:DoxX-like protein
VFILTIAVSALLAAAMAQSALRKANPGKDSLMLRDRLAVAPKLWAAVGIPEAFAAVGLIAGLRWAALGVAAAAGVALLMAGAVVLHLRARFLGAALVPPTSLAILATAAAVLRCATA